MTKTVVITGSTSGIGKELVKIFVESGDFKIFAAYRNKDLIITDSCVEYFYMDMTNKMSIVDAAEAIKSKTKKIDILINVAGCVVAGPVECLSTDSLREQFEVNTFSHIEFTQKLLPLLENGKIINISSMASFGNFPFISPYCASKRALDIFFNALSLENHKNIKVISVKPGVIATPIWKKSVDNNLSNLEGCIEYKKELEFLKNNALRNSNRGLDVKYVAAFIKNISEKPNPKCSYTIGYDAKFAHIISLLPQGIINSLVKWGLKLRVK